MTPSSYVLRMEPRGNGRPRATLMADHGKIRAAIMPVWGRNLTAAVKRIVGVLRGCIRIHEAQADIEWKAEARRQLAAQHEGPPLEGPLSVTIVASWEVPKSRHRVRTPVPASWRTAKPDADNVSKSVLDAANGLIWGDDAQVAQLHVHKVTAPQGEPGGLLILVADVDALAGLLASMVAVEVRS